MTNTTNTELDTAGLRAKAEAAEKDGQHIYTHGRDSNKYQDNMRWHRAASPELFLALLDERDDLKARLERAEAGREAGAQQTTKTAETRMDTGFHAGAVLGAQAAAGAVPELLAALKPFADAYAPTAAHDEPDEDPKMRAFLDRNTITPCVTVGDFRKAHEVAARIAAAPPFQDLPAAPTKSLRDIVFDGPDDPHAPAPISTTSLPELRDHFQESAASGASLTLSSEAASALFVAMTIPPAAAPSEPVAMARRFHETYERLAPKFGYETRPDTREFDSDSANGKLMIAVCAALATPPAQDAGTAAFDSSSGAPIPPTRGTGDYHSADAALLAELRRWAGDDKGYAACMIRSAANEIERLDRAIANSGRTE